MYRLFLESPFRDSTLPDPHRGIFTVSVIPIRDSARFIDISDRKTLEDEDTVVLCPQSHWRCVTCLSRTDVLLLLTLCALRTREDKKLALLCASSAINSFL